MYTIKNPPEVQTMRSSLNIGCHDCGYSIRRGHTYVRPDTRGPAFHLTCYLRDVAHGLMQAVAS